MEEESSDICLNLFTPTFDAGHSRKEKLLSKKERKQNYSDTFVQNAIRETVDFPKFTTKTPFKSKSQVRPPDNGGEQTQTEAETELEPRTFMSFGNQPRKKVKAKDPKSKQLESVSGDGRPKQAHRTHPGKISSLFGNNPEIPSFARRVVKPVQEAVFSTKQFKDLPIHQYSVSNLEQQLGLNTMTTVQQKAIPILLSGKDALVRSQTGSGKTLAYALPIVETLQRIRPELTRTDGIQAVVVVPTRELALQTYECFVKLVKPFNRLVPGYLVGGEKRKAEKARLRKGLTVLVGTPGRLLDHVQHTKNLRLHRARWLVLDEADRLLDMGYERDIASLVSALDSQDPTKPMLPWLRDAVNKTDVSDYDEDEEPHAETGANIHADDSKDDCKSAVDLTQVKQKPVEPCEQSTGRQTVLLSATLTPAVERLAGLTLHSPVFVDAADASDAQQQDAQSLVIPESLLQFYMVTPAKLRLVTLAAFILWKCRMSGQHKMLLFCATQDMVDYYTELLTEVLAHSSTEDSSSDEEALLGFQDGLNPTVHVQFFKLHGSMSQKERTTVFKTFRLAESGVLLCTDVASRGLDLPHVDWIIQFTAPTTISDYVHRVGRTARVGSAGSALILLTPTELQFLRLLEDHRIRLQEETMDRCLQNLVLSSTGNRQKPPGSVEAAATALQGRFETAVLNQRALHNIACKAYVSWARFYASYPKDLRSAFSFKSLHLGHHAKSFALRDPPSTIGGIGRKQWETRPKRPRKPRDPGTVRKSFGAQSKDRTRQLMTSEYSSGLEPLKKKRRKMDA